MARYRTPRKKTTNWKSILGASALGIVLIAAGSFFLLTLPEIDAVEPAVPGGAGGGATDREPAQRANADVPEQETDAPDPGDDDTPINTATTRVGGTFLGVGLILTGVLLPVGAVVIEKTSGKKWARRAGKKHPFKRKI